MCFILLPGAYPAVLQAFRLLSVCGSPPYLLPREIHQRNLSSLVAYLPCLVSSGEMFGLSSLYSYSCGFFFSISAGHCVFLIHPLLVIVPCFVRLFAFRYRGCPLVPFFMTFSVPSVLRPLLFLLGCRLGIFLGSFNSSVRLLLSLWLRLPSMISLGRPCFFSPWPRLGVWAGSRRFLVWSPFRARFYVCPFFLNFGRRLSLRPILCLVLSMSGLWRTLSGTFLMNFSFALCRPCVIIFIVLPPWCLSRMLSSCLLVGLLMRCSKTL